MPADTLALSKELQVLFFFPYNLGFSTAHLPPPELKALFGKVAERLGRRYPAYRFAAASYPPLTGTILEGGAFLRGVPVSDGSSSQALIERELGTLGVIAISAGVGFVMHSRRSLDE